MTMAPRVMSLVVHRKPLPKGVCDGFAPWKKMPFWLGTGAEVSSRAPDAELAEPVAEMSAGDPVEFAFAVQYVVPISLSRTKMSAAWFESPATRFDALLPKAT